MGPSLNADESSARNEKGKAVLDFKGIPVEQVSQLAEALKGERPPVREVRRVEQPAVG